LQLIASIIKQVEHPISLSITVQKVELQSPNNVDKLVALGKKKERRLHIFGGFGIYQFG
jgi:hypothetical protein